MCGRYSLALTSKQIQDHFAQVKLTHEWHLNYNIAPTHKALVITNDLPGTIQLFEWGLIPNWSKSSKNTGRLINARKETIASKPSFKEPYREKRCLVLADSYYEWKLYGKQKIPYRIFLKDKGLMILAGIWDEWKQGDKIIKTFSILTTPANPDVDHIHTRMPVILETNKKQQNWLKGQELETLLESLSPNLLQNYLVTSKLNKVGFNDSEAHQALPELRDLFS